MANRLRLPAAHTRASWLRSRLWRWYCAFSLLTTAAYYAAPADVQSLVFVSFGFLAAAVVVAGVAIHRPPHALPWLFFAGGQLAFALGDATWEIYVRLLGSNPFPSVADVFYLGAYPLTALGLVVLVRTRYARRDLASLVDALLVTTALAAVSWTFLMLPYARDPSLSLVERLVSIAYPLGDVLLLALAARLFAAPGGSQVAHRLIGAWLSIVLVTDVAFGAMSLAGTYADGSLIDAGWFLSYASLGAAALHPSMRAVGARSRRPAADVRKRRLALLAAASLTVPVLLAVQTARDAPLDSWVLAASSAVLAALVVVRLAGLIATRARDAERELILRQAATALVAAADRGAIEDVAMRAAMRLAPPGAAVVLSHEPGLRVGTERLRRTLEMQEADEELLEALGLGQSRPAVVLVPLIVDGELRAALAVASPSLPARDERLALEALAAQVTLALEAAALREAAICAGSDSRFRSLVQNATDVIVVADAAGRVRYGSPSIRRLLGHDPEALYGRRLLDHVHPEDTGQCLELMARAKQGAKAEAKEFRIRRHDGTWGSFETTAIDLLDDPSVAGIVLTARDVGERKALEEQLRYQTLHDPLTGLANRTLFVDRLEHALARRDGRGRRGAVIVLDLDDFKAVNDTLGHPQGDLLLRDVADRLRGVVRPSDTVARLGGDEFGVLLDDALDISAAIAVAERIALALDAPFALDGGELFVRASIGLAANVTPGANASELVQNADLAVHAAKADGSGGYRIFEVGMQGDAFERLRLKGDLQRALEREQLTLAYQPIVDLGTGRVVAAEALARWDHSERGQIPPSEFIPLAEDSGLILSLGRWALFAACREAALWQAGQGPRIAVSVNLSARQLESPALGDDLAEALRSTGLEPGRLILEVTETALARDPEAAAERLRALKRAGVRIAVDDFGTGYSSLGSLARLPVDLLKIAKPFVDDLTSPAGGGRLAASIVGMASSLGLPAIAEGIELEEQADRLRELGCAMAQGYFFARPLPPAAFRELVCGTRAEQAVRAA